MKQNNRHLPLLTSSLLLTLAVSCSSETESNGYVAPTESKNPNLSSNASVGTTSTYSSDETYYVELSGFAVAPETAKKLVITLAGVNENSVKGYVCNTQDNNGIYTYDISFWVGKVQYFYSVSGTDGAVLYFTTVFHDSEYVEPEEDEVIVEEVEEFLTSAGNLSESQARDVVFLNAGISANMVSNYKIKDKINGNINEYEITFQVGTTEYYYTIMAASGIITLAIVTEPEVETPVPEISIPDVVPVPSTPVVTTPSVEIPNVILPDITPSTDTSTPTVTPDVVPETATPEPSSPSVPTAISAVAAKGAALSYAGIAEAEVSRLSVSESTDSSGNVTAYLVTFFHSMDYHTYRVDATTGSVQIG